MKLKTYELMLNAKVAKQDLINNLITESEAKRIINLYVKEVNKVSSILAIKFNQKVKKVTYKTLIDSRLF